MIIDVYITEGEGVQLDIVAPLETDSPRITCQSHKVYNPVTTLLSVAATPLSDLIGLDVTTSTK